MEVHIMIMIIGATWSILNIWAYLIEGNIVNIYVGIFTLTLICLTFSLLVEQGVIA